VRADNEVEVVLARELFDDVRAEGEGYSAVALGPPADVGVGVGPEYVAEQPCAESQVMRAGTCLVCAVEGADGALFSVEKQGKPRASAGDRRG
jgi:hypothetical protein